MNIPYLSPLLARAREVAMSPVIGSAITTGALLDNTPAELRPYIWISPEERLRQLEIIMARRYHDGRHFCKLSTRLKSFLHDEAELFGPRVNFIQKINRAIASRLKVEAIVSTCKNEAEKARQGEWADDLWGFSGGGSRMPQKRGAFHTDFARDGEVFLLVDWDPVKERPRLTPHKRYTDIECLIEFEHGDGDGCHMVYPDGDFNQEPTCGVHRWTAINYDAAGRAFKQMRLNLHFPDRVQRWALVAYSWVLEDEIPWTSDGTANGEPLGIPMVHFRAPSMRPAAREAIPLQKGLNKLFVDMMAASDFDSWRVLVAFGWKPPKEINPGTIIGSTAPPQDASIESIEAGDPSNAIALIDKTVALMGDVCTVPLALIQTSAQRAAEGTLQEEKEDFVNLVQDYADGLGVGYSDALRIARRLENTFGAPTDGEFDEDDGFDIQWKPFYARSIADLAAETTAMLAAGFPAETIWRDVWGKDETEIAQNLAETEGDPKVFTPAGAGTTPKGSNAGVM